MDLLQIERLRVKGGLYLETFDLKDLTDNSLPFYYKGAKRVSAVDSVSFTYGDGVLIL